VLPNTRVAGAEGDEHLERLRLCDTATGTVEEVPAGFLFVFIGAAPCTDWLDGVVERDPWFLESSVPGVFVAGDVRAESVKRVASAVGEGAMAVTLVHRYLDER